MNRRSFLQTFGFAFGIVILASATIEARPYTKEELQSLAWLEDKTIMDLTGYAKDLTVSTKNYGREITIFGPYRSKAEFRPDFDADQITAIAIWLFGSEIKELKQTFYNLDGRHIGTVSESDTAFKQEAVVIKLRSKVWPDFQASFDQLKNNASHFLLPRFEAPQDQPQDFGNFQENMKRAAPLYQEHEAYREAKWNDLAYFNTVFDVQPESPASDLMIAKSKITFDTYAEAYSALRFGQSAMLAAIHPMLSSMMRPEITMLGNGFSCSFRMWIIRDGPPLPRILQRLSEFGHQPFEYLPMDVVFEQTHLELNTIGAKFPTREEAEAAIRFAVDRLREMIQADLGSAEDPFNEKYVTTKIEAISEKGQTNYLPSWHIGVKGMPPRDRVLKALGDALLARTNVHDVLRFQPEIARKDTNILPNRDYWIVRFGENYKLKLSHSLKSEELVGRAEVEMMKLFGSLITDMTPLPDGDFQVKFVQGVSPELITAIQETKLTGQGLSNERLDEIENILTSPAPPYHLNNSDYSVQFNRHILQFFYKNNIIREDQVIQELRGIFPDLIASYKFVPFYSGEVTFIPGTSPEMLREILEIRKQGRHLPLSLKKKIAEIVGSAKAESANQPAAVTVQQNVQINQTNVVQAPSQRKLNLERLPVPKAPKVSLVGKLLGRKVDPEKILEHTKLTAVQVERELEIKVYELSERIENEKAKSERYRNEYRHGNLDESSRTTVRGLLLVSRKLMPLLEKRRLIALSALYSIGGDVTAVEINQTLRTAMKGLLTPDARAAIAQENDELEAELLVAKEEADLTSDSLIVTTEEDEAYLEELERERQIEMGEVVEDIPEPPKLPPALYGLINPFAPAFSKPCQVIEKLRPAQVPAKAKEVPTRHAEPA